LIPVHRPVQSRQATVRAWARLAGVVTGYAFAAALYARAAPGGLVSPWFVFVAMVCVLGLAFVAQPLVPLRVPAFIREVRASEVAVYRMFGVPAFGQLLRRTPLRLLNQQVYLAGGTDPASLLRLLEAAEASHLLSAFLTVPYLVYAGARRDWVTLACFLVAQALINVYPIAHLRLARRRVLRVARRRA
jgi:hypothetical protein